MRRQLFPSDPLPLMWLLVALVSAYLTAIAAYPALSLKRPLRNVVIAGFLLLLAISPLWIPSTARVGRFFATFAVFTLMAKLYDLHVGSRGSRPPPFRTYLGYLPNWFWLVYRADPGAPGSASGNLRKLARATGKVILALVPSVLAFRINWESTPFLLEHAVKGSAVFMTLVPVTAMVTALLRLGGAKARDFMDRPFLASTPAEFWQRYNRPTGQFFYEDVFKPFGGRRTPLRATFATFAVSALLHEYVFGIILGRVQGYQTLFFLIQGLAVMSTLRMRPTGWKKWAGIALTLSFNLISSLLFCASVNQIIPLYSRPMPWPLAGW
jgi:hypothetical protein